MLRKVIGLGGITCVGGYILLDEKKKREIYERISKIAKYKVENKKEISAIKKRIDSEIGKD